jgi:type IV fimbrial biogenesis protein FimT
MPTARRRQHGVSLVESMIVVAIGAVCVGAVVPSFEQARGRLHLEGASAQLQTDMQYARSLAVLHNRSTRISFSNANACYVLHTGSSGSCTCSGNGAAACAEGAEALRVVALGADARLALHSNSASILFDGAQGTVTPTATVQISAAGGASLRNVVSLMGRIRSCSPAPGLPGYPAC